MLPFQTSRPCPFCLGATRSMANGRLRRTVRSCPSCDAWTDGKGRAWTSGGWAMRRVPWGCLAVVEAAEEKE